VKIILALLAILFLHGCTFRPPVTSGTVTSAFGLRSNPFNEGAIQFHNGTDIGLPIGTPVSSVARGRVTRTNYCVASWCKVDTGRRK